MLLAKCQTCLSATRGLGILSLYSRLTPFADGVKLSTFNFSISQPVCQRRGRVSFCFVAVLRAAVIIVSDQIPGDHRLGAQYLCVRKRCIRGGECNNAHGLSLRRG